MSQESADSGVRIAQIYLDSAEFSHRADSASLPAATRAEVGDVTVQLEVGLTRDGKGGRARITVSTKPENNPHYQFQVVMVALVTKVGAGGLELGAYLSNSAAVLLYPFVREALANLTQRGRFGPIWLSPILTATLQSAPPKPAKRARPNRKAATPGKK